MCENLQCAKLSFVFPHRNFVWVCFLIRESFRGIETIEILPQKCSYLLSFGSLLLTRRRLLSFESELSSSVPSWIVIVRVVGENIMKSSMCWFSCIFSNLFEMKIWFSYQNDNQLSKYWGCKEMGLSPLRVHRMAPVWKNKNHKFFL